MASPDHYESEAAASLARRIDLALSALGDALNGFTPRTREAMAAAAKKRVKRAAPVVPLEPARAVLIALTAAYVLGYRHRRDDLGALTWYEIKSQTGLTDDALGLTLSKMIPRLVCTRDTGDERIYFLPRDERRKLRASVPGAEQARAA